MQHFFEIRLFKGEGSFKNEIHCFFFTLTHLNTNFNEPLLKIGKYNTSKPPNDQI